MTDPTGHECHVIRWRFFVNNCWLSLTVGISIYVGTLILGYPYGWIALVYVVKFALWSLKDMSNLCVVLSSDGVAGPGFTFTSEPRYIPAADIIAQKTGIRGGRFFIEGQDGTSITSRLFWYNADDRTRIREFISSVNPKTYLNLVDILT